MGTSVGEAAAGSGPLDAPCARGGSASIGGVRSGPAEGHGRSRPRSWSSGRRAATSCDDDPRGWRLGGGASYAALALARLGLRVGALMVADDARRGVAPSSTPARGRRRRRIVPRARGPVFVNTETPTGPRPADAAGLGPGRAGGAAARRGATRGAWMSRRSRRRSATRGRRSRPADALVALGWQGLLRVLVPASPSTLRPPGAVAGRASGRPRGRRSRRRRRARRPRPSTSRRSCTRARRCCSPTATRGGTAYAVGRAAGRPRARGPGRAIPIEPLRGPGRRRRHVPRRRVRGAGRSVASPAAGTARDADLRVGAAVRVADPARARAVRRARSRRRRAADAR